MSDLYRNPLGGCAAAVLAVSDVVTLLLYRLGRINGKLPDVDGCVYAVGGIILTGLVIYAWYGFSRNPQIIDGELRKADDHIDRYV
ncbi:MAG: hypothetical protein J4428_00720 [Candidatus Aenigmarchaeota archaeon]|nr:hypothetical protein [Candidatus Aenigmarchaeota archaeon]